MLNSNNLSADRKIISFISFFLFSGYYFILILVFSLGLKNYSRYITVPLRLILCFLMIYLIFRLKKKWNKFVRLFILFSIIYISKIFYTEIIITDEGFLSRSWYIYILYYLSFSFLPLITFYSINFSKYYKNILNTILASGLLLNIFAIYFYIDIIFYGVGRLNLAKYNGFLIDTLNPLSLGYSGALLITLSLNELLNNRNKIVRSNIYLLILIVTSLILFFLSSSRGPLIAILVSIILILKISNLKGKINALILILLSIPVVVHLIKFTGSNIIERILASIIKGDTSERWELYNEALNEFIKNPFLGGRIEISGIYPHNLFLEILMGTGILGLILFLPLIIVSFKLGFRIVKMNPEYAFLMIVLINGFIQYMFSGSIYGAILLFAPMGIILSKSK